MANYPWTVRHFSNILNSSNISDANAQLLANAPTSEDIQEPPAISAANTSLAFFL